MAIWAVSLQTTPAYPGKSDSFQRPLRIRSLIVLPRLRLEGHSVALPHKGIMKRLYLNIFRGESAISGFDQHITPNHRSSHVISPTKSSGLLPAFAGIHPVHGQLTQFRIVPLVLKSPYSGSLSLRLHKYYLFKQMHHNDTLAGSFFNRHAITPPKAGLSLFVSQWFQVLFHSPRRGTFHLSLTVLVHYRSI